MSRRVPGASLSIHSGIAPDTIPPDSVEATGSRVPRAVRWVMGSRRPADQRAYGKAEAGGGTVSPAAARLTALRQHPTDIGAGKMISGWRRGIGAAARLGTADGETFAGGGYDHVGTDMYSRDWGGDIDPEAMLSCSVADQVLSCSDSCCSSPLHGRMDVAQAGAIDRPERVQELVARAPVGLPPDGLQASRNLSDASAVDEGLRARPESPATVEEAAAA